jgi:hypothetical protein
MNSPPGLSSHGRNLSMHSVFLEMLFAYHRPAAVLVERAIGQVLDEGAVQAAGIEDAGGLWTAALVAVGILVLLTARILRLAFEPIAELIRALAAAALATMLTLMAFGVLLIAALTGT